MSLTAEDLERVLVNSRRQRQEQGLPPKVTDPSTVARLAAIVAAAPAASEQVA